MFDQESANRDNDAVLDAQEKRVQDGLEPEGSWPGWFDCADAGLTLGLGSGPGGYFTWEDVARALLAQKRGEA